MSLGHGASIVRNGLVFHYDMENTDKSWKGAPTTNYVSPAWSGWSVDGSGQGSIGTRTILTNYHCLIVDSNSNTRQSTWVEGLSASTTYTFSVKYKKISGAPTLRFQLQAYNGGSYISLLVFATTAQLGITDTDGWQIASYTVTTPANTTRALWFMQDGNDYTTYTHSFELKEPQCEQNSFATPFVAGTRSNTQSVIDLTRVNTVTMTAATYESSGDLRFDGSNDYLTISTFNNKPTTQITCEVLFKPTKPSVAGSIRGTGISATNSMYLGIIDSTDGGNTFSMHWANQTSVSRVQSWNGNIPNNAWSHLVGTYDGTTMKAYLNGIEIHSAAQTGTIPDATYVLGTYGGALQDGFHNFNGYIEVAKIYNRALTATEVKQNFNAYRGRYGI